MIKYDYIIVGAGIVGLAAALRLLESDNNLRIAVLEKESFLGAHQTGNNSGVIHSGIYYRPGSLKAENCRRGYDLLLDFCKSNDVEYDICGKIIAAVNDEEVKKLPNILERGLENGLTGLKIIGEKEMREIEPNIRGVKGIFVPQTGIVDFKEVLKKYAGELESKGCSIEYNINVEKIKEDTDSVILSAENENFLARYAIFCTGLQSDRMARQNFPDLDYRIIPFRGEYYKLNDRSKYLVKNLIYPVPDSSFPFLGVHFTRKINGEVEAGPNAVLSFAREGYGKLDFNLNDTVSTFAWRGFQKIALKYWKTGIGEFYRSFSKRAFTNALQKLVPAVQIGDLETGGAGIRAQACDIKGNLIDDFYLKKTKRILHVCNAPSPAATASLAIGEKIAKLFLN